MCMMWLSYNNRALLLTLASPFHYDAGKYCPPLKADVNGTYDDIGCGLTGRYAGDQCVLTCWEGHVIVGNDTSGCLDTGNWTEEPYCRSKKASVYKV